MEIHQQQALSGKPPFEDIFKTEEERQNNFLARFFGLFCEKIVLAWCKCPNTPYTNLGRPSLYIENKYINKTLDFTLCRRETGEIFVAGRIQGLLKKAGEPQGVRSGPFERDDFMYVRLSSGFRLDQSLSNPCAT